MADFDTPPPQEPNRRGRLVTGAIAQLSDAKSFLGAQYMLFVGICSLGYFIGGAVPFYLLLGPMLCGIYYCMRRQERGEAVDFGMLFKGFDKFGQSIIPALFIFGASMLVIIPMQIFQFMVLAAADSRGDQEAAMFFTLLFVPVAFLVAVLAQSIVFFSFQLVQDRNLGGVAAIKESFAAVRENFLKVLVAVFVFSIAQMIGLMACCIGWFFVVPLVATAQWRMYREVYPDLGVPDIADAGDAPAHPDDWSSAPE